MDAPSCLLKPIEVSVLSEPLNKDVSFRVNYPFTIKLKLDTFLQEFVAMVKRLRFRIATVHIFASLASLNLHTCT